jgi:hypothetical protein
MEYKCNNCNKYYKTYQSLWNHNKAFHKKEPINNLKKSDDNLKKSDDNLKKSDDNLKIYKCRQCEKIYNNKQSRWSHEKKCKIKENNDNKLEEKNKIKQLEETIKDLKTYPSINNQLINLIVDKTKTIEELITKIDENKTDNNLQSNHHHILKLNNVIMSRNEDNYINANQLCNIHDKQFNDWYLLESTKKLLDYASIDIEITISQLIDIKQENNNELEQVTWIHPDLAIQLAQWISPQFALQVTKYIRTLYISNIRRLEEKNKEIKIKDNKIKLLEDLCIKNNKEKSIQRKM